MQRFGHENRVPLPSDLSRKMYHKRDAAPLDAPAMRESPWTGIGAQRALCFPQRQGTKQRLDHKNKKAR